MDRPSAFIHSAALISGAAHGTRVQSYALSNISTSFLFARIYTILLIAMLLVLHFSDLIVNINGIVSLVDLLITKGEGCPDQAR